MIVREGDVLLFEAPKWTLKTFVPHCIRLITGNKIIHVGIVINVNPLNNDQIAWTDTNPRNGMVIRMGSISSLMQDYRSGMKLTRIAHLPNRWYSNDIANSFSKIAYILIDMNSSHHYSYRIILSFMFDHSYRLFRPKNEPYRNWFGANGYVCSTLVATIINLVMSKYQSDWHGGKWNLNTWEPDDFTTDLFQVESCDSKIS